MIKGLSERRRLPRAGKIKLGVVVQVPGRKSYPRATDYFVIPEAVQNSLGVQQPKELPIMFPVDEPDRIFPQVLKLYHSAGLYCSGDKERARRWSDQGQLREIDCPCPFFDSGECGPVATLNFLLPDVPGIGVFQIDTGNKDSITSLNTGLEQFQTAFGGLRGIPFLLKLEPQQKQRWDEAQKKMVKTTIYVMRLDSPYTLRQIIEWRSKLGKPVEALMPMAEPEVAEMRIEPDEGGNGGEEPSSAHDVTPITDSVNSVPLSDSAPVPWTIEACFAAAKRAGIGAEDYSLYLTHKHRQAVEDLPPEAILKEGEAWAAAEESALARETLKSIVLTVVGKTKGR